MGDSFKRIGQPLRATRHCRPRVSLWSKASSQQMMGSSYELASSCSFAKGYASCCRSSAYGFTGDCLVQILSVVVRKHCLTGCEIVLPCFDTNSNDLLCDIHILQS